jgi:hypothetical protein
VQVIPLGQVTSLGVEYLNPVILSVRHIYGSFFIGGNTMNYIELPWVGARLAPGEEAPSIGREFVNPGISIPVCHIQIASPWI